MRSFLLVGSIQTLGGEQPNFLDLGSFLSDYIINDETADAFLDHQAEWNFFARSSAVFNTWWRAADLEQTDCILLDHPRLPPDDRPEEVTTLSSDMLVDALSGSFSSMSDLDDDDYIRIGGECLLITSGSNVSRGALGTDAEEHESGSPVYKFDRKFFIKHIGYSPMSLDWRITAEALPA